MHSRIKQVIVSAMLAAMTAGAADQPAAVVTPAAPGPVAVPAEAPAQTSAPATDHSAAAASAQATSPASAGDHFGARLMLQLASSAPHRNTVLSTLSLDYVGGLLLAGAQGKTQTELLEAFGGKNAGAQQTLDALHVQRQQLLADKSADLRLANGIWLAQGEVLKPDYTKHVEEALGAKAQSLDFSKPDAVQQVNAWFSTGTAGLIPHLLDRLTADAHAVLGNALYFKGHWEHAFDPARTLPGTFHASEGDVQRPLMHQKVESALYRENQQGQALRLAFTGTGYEMLVILPKTGTTPQSLIGDDGSGLAAWLDTSGYAKQEVQLSLPKLSLESSAELLDPLRNLGLVTAFGPQADYHGMSDTPIRVDRIVQKTVLKVDETGAEAAAATAAVMTRSAVVDTSKTMTVDHPYLVVLRHIPSGALVMMAIVQDPGSS